MEYRYFLLMNIKRFFAFHFGIVMLVISQIILKFLLSSMLGVLASIPLILLKDGIMQGQSPAKKVFGLMVINVKTNTPCSLGFSFKRNFFRLLCNFPFLYFISSLKSRQEFDFVSFFSIILAFIILIVNIVYYFRDGKLIHDRWAGTMVINKKDYTPNNNLE